MGLLMQAFLNKVLRHTDLMLGVGLIGVVAMLILPLPHWLLDLGLVVAIASSVIILLSSVNVDDPMKFSVFPSMLLITTLFRLSLSVAATKLILGTAKAGQVIETFGNFVMGGDFVVGLVAFLILMIVQFIVITNGAGRVSEVVARFTLDAMPGKQMAIDADLAAGLIDEEQARDRRRQVKREADFYGAMDGASKFVKGDAIAAILIIVVNIVGGFAVGFFRGGGDALSILKSYTLLSVGEGLVSQIPALLISTASGLLVTRAGQERSMSGEVIFQVLAQPKALMAAGIAMVCFGFIPGFPLAIFAPIGAGLVLISRMTTKSPNAAAKLAGDAPKPKAAQPAVPSGPEAVLPLLAVDPLEIEIGFGLTPLADAKSGGDLADRVTSTRRQIALDLGFVMPTVRIRDSVSLGSQEYIIKVRGEEIARAYAEPTMLLAISSGIAAEPIPGTAVKEPVFGLDALWIDRGMKEDAERNGYTVIEPSAMLATHLSEIVKNHCAELLGRQDVQMLITNAKQHNPALVDELIPGIMSIGDIQKVLQHLLREKVPIRDMVTILETLADFGGRVKEPDQLGELVRASIARTITRQVVDHENKVHCLTLEPALERLLADSIQQTSMGSILALDPAVQSRLIEGLRGDTESAMTQGVQPILLCGNQLRLPLKRLIDRYLPGLNVLAYNEVAANADVEIMGALRVA